MIEINYFGYLDLNKSSKQLHELINNDLKILKNSPYANKTFFDLPKTELNFLNFDFFIKFNGDRTYETDYLKYRSDN